MVEYFNKLKDQYQVPLENVLSIAINRYGICIDDYQDSRIRFHLKFANEDRSNYFAVCVNTYPSPFVLKQDGLYLEGSKIAEVFGIEKDTCTSTYFRNNKKAITFNSNARSQCRGCAFCGTYSLDENESVFTTKGDIIQYFDQLLKENDIDRMKEIESVTLCTGCFESEDDLVQHILLVNEAFKEMGYAGSLNYIGSQLRDYDKLQMIRDHVGDFGLYLTIEKFLDREKYMRKEKASLTLPEAKDLLAFSSSLGMTTTFLYILGLEPIEVVDQYFNYFKDSINKFPIVQVFQNYTASQEQYRCSEAKDVEYYLKARKHIDEIFSDTPMNPKLWECFRSLYYEGKEKEKCKIKS